jgi:Nucleotidyl transferase AbiEii toxin, Type IV TA system
MAAGPPEWHEEAVTEGVTTTIRDLSARPLLADFYLAGGTALALRFGHRRSLDLDFFSERGLDPDGVVQGLLGLDRLAVVSTAADTAHVTVRGVKVSFLAYRFPALFSFAHFCGAAVADPRDVACMKVTAVAGRGAKRDFIDLYFAAQRLGGLRAILEWFLRKYAAANYSRPHLLKSFTYFSDADQDPMPDMLVPCEWSAVKRFFTAEAPRLL